MLRRALTLLAVAWSFPILLSLAGQLPLTAKEISLMLRTGYSSAALLQELAVRHFADTIDPTNEKMLEQAGASSALIEALKQGTFSLSPAQSAAAQQQIVEAAKRRDAEGQRLRFDTLYRDQIAQKRSVARTPASGTSSIYELVKDDLVSWQNGALAHFDDPRLEDKKLIAFYFPRTGVGHAESLLRNW